MTGDSHADREPAAPPKSVLARGLTLLDAFGADEELRLADLAARTGLPKPTTHRLLAELVAWGGVERTGTGYRLGTTLFRLGQRVTKHQRLRTAAMPYLEDLYESTRENVHLAVPDGVDTLFIEKLAGRASTPILSGVGGSLPGYCTATGKLFLALDGARMRALLSGASGGLRRFTVRTIVSPRRLYEDLSETADRGYGINLGESEDGVVAVAAPVRDATGEVIAAISVTGYVRRLDLRRLTPIVRTAARGLTARLDAR